MTPKGTVCEALGCDSNTRNKTGPFFLFPIDPVRRRKWQESIRMKPPLERKLQFLCSRHFSQEAFINSFCWKLCSNAVPTKQHGPLMYKKDLYGPPEETNNDENSTFSGRSFRLSEVPKQRQLLPKIQAEDITIKTFKNKKVPPLRIRFPKNPEKRHLAASLKVKSEETAERTTKIKTQSPNGTNSKVKTEEIALSSFKMKNHFTYSKNRKVKKEVTSPCPAENNYSPKKFHFNIPIKVEKEDSCSDEGSGDLDEDDDLQFFKAIVPFIRYLPHNKKMNLRMKIQEVVSTELYGY